MRKKDPRRGKRKFRKINTIYECEKEDLGSGTYFKESVSDGIGRWTRGVDNNVFDSSVNGEAVDPLEMENPETKHEKTLNVIVLEVTVASRVKRKLSNILFVTFNQLILNWDN